MALLRSAKNKEIGKVVLLPVNKIISNPNQPRKHFDEDAIQELCRSIVTNGLLQPVTVRKAENDCYELIAGERRTMAFRALGREYIPGIVDEFSDAQSAVLALVENLQRKDLNYFEEATGISRLMAELNLTQSQASQKLGKAQSTVANKLRLLKYPDHIQQKMLEAGLTERHARAMLKVADTEMLDQVVEHVISDNMNVEQTEQYIEILLATKEDKKATKVFVVKDIRIFVNTMNKAISIMRSSGIPVDMDKRDGGEYLEYVLKIPKSEAYRPVVEKQPQCHKVAL